MIALKKLWISATLLSLLMAGSVVGETAEPFADGVVNTTGAIQVPKNFRATYILLGAWSVKSADPNGVGLHLVYAPPDVVGSYRITGLFPDGSVLVKELFNGHTDELTTGIATRAAETVGYFVMVKDDKVRFPNNPLWGDGWSWSFFTAKDRDQTTSTEYRQDCLGCQEPARKTGLVYTEGYPVIRAFPGSYDAL